MPTDQELRDLNSNCDWTWTTQNGVNGYVVRGRGIYASNSIFLPAAGHGDRTSHYFFGSHGFYWSSVPGSTYDIATHIRFDSVYYYLHHYRCTYGFSVRPVQGPTN